MIGQTDTNHAFDGFSLEQVYAVGGSGVVFKYDGKRWKQMGFPTNIRLLSVCCGGDGSVYDGAGGGRIYRGKDHKWELMRDGERALPYRDMVWHKNQLWCSKDEKPVDALPPKTRVCCVHLPARDAILLERTSKP